MSAISGFISQIQNAVYGEQVRGAIVAALEQCYSDVTNPDLNTEAFETALNEAYAGGILDIQTVTSFNDMTNDKIIYRYNGTAAGKQKGLYYFSALSSSWVLIGSEIQKVSLLSQMTDTNDIYKYVGTETGMVQNSLYCYNGTAWVPIGSGVLEAATAAQMTNTGAIYKYTGNESGYTTNALYYYNGTAWVTISANPNIQTTTFSGQTSGNMFDASTMLREGYVISSNGIVQTDGSAIAIIPVEANTNYAIQIKSAGINTGNGVALLDSSENVLLSAKITGSLNADGFYALNVPVMMSPASFTEKRTVSFDTTYNGYCVKTTTGTAFLAINAKTSGGDGISSLMVEEGITCSDYTGYAGGTGEAITSMYNKSLADRFLRYNAITRSNIGRYGGASEGKNKFDIATMMLAGYVVTTGAINPSTNSSIALCPVVGGKSYSIQKKYAKWQGNGAVLLLDSNLSVMYAIQITTDTANGDFYVPSTINVVTGTGQTPGIIVATADGANKGVTFNTIEGVAYIAFNLAISSPYAIDVQVEEGTTCTAYEDYAGTALSGAEIETLCGAYFVDVKAREALGLDPGGSTPKPYDGVEWVAIGDSITQGGGGGGGYYVNEIVNDLGFDVINAAVGGVRLAAGLTQANQITSDTKIVTVALGTNDADLTDEQIGQLGDTTGNTSYAYVYQIINKILTEHPNIILGFIIPVPRYTSAEARECVRKVSKAIKESCEYYCIPCIDLQTTIGFAEQVKNIYYMDNLHPSTAGAHRMALAIEPWMSGLLGEM